MSEQRIVAWTVSPDLHGGPSMISVIRGDRKVEWVDTGEGFFGDYDPSDPDDVALLRFDVLYLDEDSCVWEYMDDASYCTQMPADSSEDILRRGAEIIMNATYGKSSIKKICEELSWIAPGWCVEPDDGGVCTGCREDYENEWLWGS